MNIKIEITVTDLESHKQYKEIVSHENIVDLDKDLNYNFDVCKERIIKEIPKPISSPNK